MPDVFYPCCEVGDKVPYSEKGPLLELRFTRIRMGDQLRHGTVLGLLQLHVQRPYGPAYR
jgi:hypothetical protein